MAGGLSVAAHMASPAGMNILVIRFSSLGDLVTLEPTFRALRHFHRDDRITFVTSQVGKELYEDTGYFDRIVVESGSRKGHLLRRARAVRSELGNPRFDVIYHLQTSRFSHLLTALLRKDRVVHIAASLWQKLLSIKVPFRPAPELLRTAGFDAAAIADYVRDESHHKIALGVDAARAESFRLRLAEAGSARPVIALAPGASARWESKKWGDEHFAELAAKLQCAGAQVIVVGSSLENAAALLIQQRADRALDFTGQTSVGQLKALLSNTDVFIGNDSGPAHIAAAVGTATVTIFAPTGEIHCVKHMPYRGSHVCLSPADGICRTCYEPSCPSSRTCMASIGISRVFHAAVELAHARDSER
jgi:ADP-heptose:LPS heptosyltransferase